MADDAAKILNTAKVTVGMDNRLMETLENITVLRLLRRPAKTVPHWVLPRTKHRRKRVQESKPNLQPFLCMTATRSIVFRYSVFRLVQFKRVYACVKWLTMALATESGNSLAMMAKEAVTNPALPLAWIKRMTKDRTINVVASSILSKNLTKNRQTTFTHLKTCFLHESDWVQATPTRK